MKIMKSSLKSFLIFVAIMLVIGAVFSFYDIQKNKTENISLIQLSNSVKNGEIKKIDIAGDKLNIELRDGSFKKSKKEQEESLIQSLINLGVSSESLSEINIEISDESGLDFWAMSILPFLLPFILIAFFVWFMFRKVQGANSKAMSFGESKAKQADQKKKTVFNDVAGAKEAKEELYEIVDFLKDPQKFIKLGAEIPKGVLLLGAPGTGKTLLARAISGEAGVPFFHISGSEFVEMFVGVGSRRVKSLFAKAKQTQPSIIFIDELDAIGRRRGSGYGGGHDEREQTLNQILVEMDGFKRESKVILLAATNRPDTLDPALLRPGRFDRRVVTDIPDIKGREEILKIHNKNKPLEKQVDLEEIAKRTAGFSGADLENVANEAAILATRRHKKNISQEDLMESIEKVLLGPERKSHLLNKEEKKITAYHEAGHALVSALLPEAETVRKVSIVARGMSAGYTITSPQKERRLATYSQLIAKLAVLLGGYSAEKLKFKEVTTGAVNDLQRASNLAQRLVEEYGMSALGPISFGEQKEVTDSFYSFPRHSEKIRAEIDQETKKLIKQAEKTAGQVLSKHQKTLAQLAHLLVEKETIEKTEFEKIVPKNKKKGKE